MRARSIKEWCPNAAAVDGLTAVRDAPGSSYRSRQLSLPFPRCADSAQSVHA